MSGKENERCPVCGHEYTAANRFGASEMWSASGKDIFCLECQERKFNQMSGDTDDEFLSLYMCCLFFNRPWDAPTAREVADAAGPGGEPHWTLYLKKMKEQGRLNSGRKYYDFRDMETSLDPRLIHAIAGSDVYERKSVASGRWGAKFTENGETVAYSDSEIRELNRMYEEQAAEYKGGAMTQRVDMAIREICVCRLEWKKCVGAGDSTGAKKYSDMIKDAMAREGLRATDSKPVENLRIDSLIDRLEKKGAIQNGTIVGRKRLLDILAADHPQYRTSLDVVDEMMMAIVNTARRNNGQGDLDSLPYTAQIADDFDELMKHPTEEEKKIMTEIGTGKVRRDGDPWKAEV